MSGAFWIDAPSASQATRLVALLDGFDAKPAADGHAHEVHIVLDGAGSVLMVKLFDALGDWPHRPERRAVALRAKER